MKSLNFSKRNLQAQDVLSKAQMKNILGGHDDGGDSGSCGAAPNCNLSCRITCGGVEVDGNCTYHASTDKCACWAVC